MSLQRPGAVDHLPPPHTGVSKVPGSLWEAGGQQAVQGNMHVYIHVQLIIFLLSPSTLSLCKHFLWP